MSHSLDAIEIHKNEKRSEDDARPITFDEFVQLYDPRDSFTAKLMEVLVKEYSERIARKTPVDRKFQIATRTSAALGAIPRDARIYSNSRRLGHSVRRNRIISTLRRQLEEDESNPRATARTDEDVTVSTSERDHFFQNALEELDDGEFGAYWNSSLNDVYAEQESLSRARRRRENFPALFHDVPIESWSLSADQDEVGPPIASGYSSSRGSDPDGHFSRSVAPQPQSRSETLINSFVGRQDSQRSSLLRRNSIRRNWYNRTSSLAQDPLHWRPFTLDTDTVRSSGGTETARPSSLWELVSSRPIGASVDYEVTPRASRLDGPSRIMSPRPAASTSIIGSSSNPAVPPYFTPTPDWNNDQVPAPGRTRWDLAWPGDGPGATGTDALPATDPVTPGLPMLPLADAPTAQPAVSSSEAVTSQRVDNLP